MPELPEVETVRRGLAELLPGRVVARVVVFDSPKSFPNAPAAVEQFLYGARVAAVRRRAKVLMIDLDTRYSLVVHLKMTSAEDICYDQLGNPTTLKLTCQV